MKQAGGFSVDQVEVLFLVDEVAELLDLQQLAFDHLLRERDQKIEDVEITLFEGRREGLHVEPVPGEHALGVAPGRVRGRASATGVGLVDDVVVHEGRSVKHLNDRSEANAAVAGRPESLGRKQQEQWANALASACDQVLRDVGDDGDVRCGLFGKLLLDSGQVVTEKVKDLGGCRDG